MLEKYFTDKPDGIPGNDDCGTMSAWAIMSMMGFYPDCPGSPYYTLTTPVFDKVTLHLDKTYYPKGDLVIETHKTQDNQRYINRVLQNGKTLNGFRISHKQLVEGGKLVYELK